MSDLVVRAAQGLATAPLALALVDAAMKGALLLAVAGLLCLLGRRSSAAVRHLIWSLALASLLVLPVLSLALPAWHVPMLPRSVSRALVEEVALRPEPKLSPAPSAPLLSATKTDGGPAPMPTGLPVETLSPRSAQAGARPQASPPSEPLPWLAWAMLIWSAGAGLALARLVSATASVWCVTRRAEALTDGLWTATERELSQRMKLARCATLLASNEVHVPMTWGLLRPVVLLPPGTESWTAERRRIALLHELAHVKRWDYLTQTVGRLACALHWMNPLAWLALHRMCVERELACDDYVLNAGLKPSSYAQHLVEIARGLRASHCAAAVAMARASGLEVRVRAVLEATRPRSAVTRLTLTVAVALAVVLILPLSTLRPTAAAQEAGEASSRSKAVFGRVIKPDGQPVGGATVYHYRWFPQDRLRLPRRDASGQLETSGIRSKVVTKPDGAFAFKDVYCGTEDRIGRRRDCIIAFARGFGVACWQPLPDLDAVSPMTLQLSQVAELRGVVVDQLGAPLRGAEVKVRSIQLRHAETGWVPVLISEDDPIPELSVTTDALGRFSIDHLPRISEGTLYLVTQHRDFVPSRDWVKLRDLSQHVSLKLKPGGTIEGKVIHEVSGAPAPGVVVSARCEGAEETAASDKNGRYAIRNLPAGRSAVRVASETTSEWTGRSAVTAAVTPGQTAEADDLVLIEGGLVSGKAIEAGTGEAAPGVALAVGETKARTGADGSFRLRCAPGTQELRITGVPNRYLRHHVGKRQTVAIQTGRETVARTFELTRGLTLSGKVVDPQSRPVPYARVLVRVEGEPDHRYTYATGDRRGSFRLDGIKPNAHYGLWVKGALTGRSAALGRRLDVVVGQEPPRDLLIQLAPVATVTGRVVDAKGQVLESAGSDRLDLRVVLSERLGKSSWQTSRQGLTEKGLYEFRVLPGSTAFVTAEFSSVYPVAPAMSSDVIAAPGERHEVDDIMLRDVVTISGAVLDREGNPLPGAVVSAWRPASELLMQVTSNEDGEFRSAPLRPPDTPIQVFARSAKGDLAGRGTFHAAKLDSDTILELAPSATAVGRVVDAKGQPIANAKVSARIEANAERFLWCHWTEASTDENGRYRLTGILAHLPAKIGAEAEGYCTWFGPARTLEEGQTLAMEDLVLTVGQSFVAGTVTDRNGWPVSGIAVSCWFSAGSVRRSSYVRTDAEGRYRIEGLPDEASITVRLGEPDYERQDRNRVPPNS